MRIFEKKLTKHQAKSTFPGSDYLRKWRIYAELSKSGIVILVLISVLSGYLIGQPSEEPLNWKRLWLTLFGVLFLASGSSALNQYQEQALDLKMPRTSRRPLPSGRLSQKEALVFIIVTLGCGLTLLVIVGSIVFWLGVCAIFSYNLLYTLWWKKHWAFAAIPGAIPGAIPILIGYAAASGTLTRPAGIYLFFILFFWQMPHFWSLALKFEKDYALAGFPTLPVVHGRQVTLHQIVLWCLAYVGLVIIGPLFLQVRWIYWTPSILLGAKILFELYRYYSDPQNSNWLRFFLWVNFSLVGFLSFAILDLWSIYIPIPGYTR